MLRPRPFAAAPPNTRRERVTGAFALLSLVLLAILVLWLLRGFWGGSAQIFG